MNNLILSAISFQVDLLKCGKKSRADLMEELVELLNIEEVSLVVKEAEVEVETPLFSMVFSKTKSYYIYR